MKFKISTVYLICQTHFK